MAVERWTDEMVDELAASVTELRVSVTELRASINQERENIAELRASINAGREETAQLRESVFELRANAITQQESIDSLKITAQALLQLAAQSQRDMEIMQQRQADSDERFNVLLEELRYLNRRNDKPENGESN